MFQRLSQLGNADSGVRIDTSVPFGILLYHRVNPDEDPFFSAVSVKVFDAQMQYLAKNFHVLSLIEVIQRIQQGRAVEPLTIAITFDDGYRDNYTFAHPILKKYNLPATVFVATGFIGTNRPMWNDRLAWRIKNAEQKRIRCQIGHRDVDLSLETQQDKVSSLNLILEQLKTCAQVEKEEALEKIIADFRGNSPEPDKLMLDWSELRNMAAEGWDIGSHTVNHVILTKVELPRAAEELSLSKATIESELQRPVGLFAFPNGKSPDFSSSLKGLAKQLGYQGAVTTLGGVNGGDTDFFEMRRLSIWEKHLPTLACKLSYLYRRQTNHEKNR